MHTLLYTMTRVGDHWFSSSKERGEREESWTLSVIRYSVSPVYHDTEGQTSHPMVPAMPSSFPFNDWCHPCVIIIQYQAAIKSRNMEHIHTHRHTDMHTDTLSLSISWITYTHIIKHKERNQGTGCWHSWVNANVLKWKVFSPLSSQKSLDKYAQAYGEQAALY